MNGQPIRWDNIVAPAGAPAQTLESAARMLNGAFSAFQAPLVQAEATQARNWDTGKANNTLDARAALMQFADAKRFKDALDGGQVANIINQYGAQADRGALMDFADSRLPTLQQRDVQGIQYKNTMLDDAQAKDRDRILGMINSGNQTLIDRAMQQLPGMDLRIKADLYRSGNEAQRRMIDNLHADEKHVWEKQKLDADILHMKNQDGIGWAHVKTARDQFGLAKEQFAQTTEDRLTRLAAEARAETAKYASTAPGSEQGIEKIGGFIKSNIDKDHQALAREIVNDVTQAYPKATASDVQNILNGMSTPGAFKNWHLYQSEADVRAQALKRAATIVGSAPSVEAATRNEVNYGAAATAAAQAAQRLNDFRTLGRDKNDPFAPSPATQALIDAAKAKGAQSQAGAPEISADEAARPDRSAPAAPPAVIPEPAKPAAAVTRDPAALKIAAAKEKLEMANGARTRYSPEVDAFVKEEYQKEISARDADRNARLKKELEKELRKARGLVG